MTVSVSVSVSETILNIFRYLSLVRRGVKNIFSVTDVMQFSNLAV